MGVAVYVGCYMSLGPRMFVLTYSEYSVNKLHVFRCNHSGYTLQSQKLQYHYKVVCVCISSQSCPCMSLLQEGENGGKDSTNKSCKV